MQETERNRLRQIDRRKDRVNREGQRRHVKERERETVTKERKQE